MISLPVSIFVKYLKSKRTAQLRQVKHREKKENQIPFKYYRSAIAAIATYHRNGNDPSVFKNAKKTLLTKLATCEKPGSAIIIKNNLRAIDQYQMHFGTKHYIVRPVPKLKIVVGEITISTRADLCALQGDDLVLIRLDMTKKAGNRVEVESLLSIIAEAAKSNGVKVKPMNVVCLRTEDGDEIQGHQLRRNEREAINLASKEIAMMWGSL
jgi:hypothetical protein